jgi:hypothetical protein
MLEPTPNKKFKNSVIAHVSVPYPFLMGPCQEKKKINWDFPTVEHVTRNKILGIALDFAPAPPTQAHPNGGLLKGEKK